MRRLLVADDTDGEQALDRWQADRDEVFALVLDHRMPRMTGLDGARPALAA